MGHIGTYICSSCGYKATVSGGADMGMMVATQTILCEDCRELYDVVVQEIDPVRRKVVPRCPQSPSHKWRKWNAPDKCPRCGKQMKLDLNDPGILWD